MWAPTSAFSCEASSSLEEEEGTLAWAAKATEAVGVSESVLGGRPLFLFSGAGVTGVSGFCLATFGARGLRGARVPSMSSTGGCPATAIKTSRRRQIFAPTVRIVKEMEWSMSFALKNSLYFSKLGWCELVLPLLHAARGAWLHGRTAPPLVQLRRNTLAK